MDFGLFIMIVAAAAPFLFFIYCNWQIYRMLGKQAYWGITFIGISSMLIMTALTLIFGRQTEWVQTWEHIIFGGNVVVWFILLLGSLDETKWSPSTSTEEPTVNGQWLPNYTAKYGTTSPAAQYGQTKWW